MDIRKKRCYGCARWLPEDLFHKSTIRKDSLQTKCKECCKIYKKNYKIGIPKSQKPLSNEKIFYIPDVYIVGYGRQQLLQHCCLGCKSPFFDFTPKKGYGEMFCENCNDLGLDVPEKNLSPFEYVGNIVGWISKSSHDSLKRSNKNFKECYERDRYTCQYCGYNLENAKEFMPLHIDHITAFSSSGSNDLSNLVVACQECNAIGGDKFFSSFDEKKHFILSRKKKIEEKVEKGPIPRKKGADFKGVNINLLTQNPPTR